MAYAFDVDDGGVTLWHARADGGVDAERDTGYAPTMHVHATDGSLGALADSLADDPKVAGLRWAEWYLDLHADDRTEVLAVDVERVREVGTLAREIRVDREAGRAPGTYRLFDVDFSPAFRYCLETGTDPTPDRELRTLAVRTTDRALADGDLASLRVDGDRLEGGEDAVLRALAARVDRRDPDVLVVSHGGLLDLASERAADLGVGFRWGREAAVAPDRDVVQLSGANTYVSYGRTGHSPARYTVTGRAVLDESNSFLWEQSGLAGLRYLVGRSWKPIEEAGWASIGNVLTAMQIRAAHARDVLVPWNKWEPEAFKDARTLQAADRGGTTLAPEVGRHRDVHEVDFASLYPTIICEYNVSPDTVGCDCHPDREVVPELDYNLCPERGFLVDVLEPLLEDRADIKDALDSATGDRRDRLEAESSAIKWVLVSCFGYQGYRNSKFGRIECHEAINAYARDVLLDAKDALERAGWHVVHGIVDSLWATPRADDPEPLDALCERVTDAAGVRLEREAHYDWVCFAPRRDGSGGALTTYFGKKAGVDPGDEDAFKLRGVEARQRSTPPFVADCQREWLRVLDRACDGGSSGGASGDRGPHAVVDALQRDLRALHGGGVDPADLAVTRRVSKPQGEYRRETRAVAARRRYDAHGVDRHPGQSVEFVVVDDDADGRHRVRLPFEDGAGDYDADHYADRLLRAAETVLSPFGWSRARVERELRSTRDASLSSF
ncbi:type B DNA-directed DNA polymerase [Halobacterium yunchengense]|uniref:type B DNA-directed DNA polymerase n=1 Tax=Halobacterium yunchengense TaxID=3108497 RepID=UPI00300989AC